MCDEHTWTALVEASWHFGDRLLFLTAPNLRGDDVAELQSRLARLGFDSGRVDGILGPRTVRALEDFQSNCGVTSDGVCGPDTVRAILRVSGQTGDGPGISTLRDRERQRGGPGSLAASRVVIGQFGGLSAISRTLARELRQHGATVMTLDEPDVIAQAHAANHFEADVYLGFESSAEPAAVAHFYRVPTFESAGGRALAEAIVTSWTETLTLPTSVTPTTSGMRLPVLRETRMPAVLCLVGPVRPVTDAATALCGAMLSALAAWVSRPA